MSERLVVKNFLCLKDIDIEVKDFLILIGPQAAGKSLCAKLLYFFRTIIEEIVRYHMMNTFNSVLGKPGSIDIYFSGKFESFFPKTYWDGQEFYIEYKLGKDAIYSITKKKHGKLEFYLDKNILESPQETIRLLAEHIKTNDNLKKINKNLNRLLSNRHIKPKSAMDIFIPAGRSFFSLLQKNIFKFLQTSNSVDPFLLEFGIFYEEIKQTGHDIPAEAQELIHSILKGDYVYAENLLLTGGRKITLELLSSGQQEALPLTLVLAYIISQRLESYDFTNIYVEEPEAHLFPDAQEQMSRLISFLQYNAGHKVKFVITTHSPYMLAAFNNLIKAGNIVKQNPRLKDAVCKEIPESMHIDIERFSAYSLKNGRAVSIIDEGNHLINADAIDSVSESIMEIFNTLLDIEFEGGEAGENV